MSARVAFVRLRRTDAEFAAPLWAKEGLDGRRFTGTDQLRQQLHDVGVLN
jgi:hypothetical protein